MVPSVCCGERWPQSTPCFAVALRPQDAAEGLGFLTCRWDQNYDQLTGFHDPQKK